MAHSIFGWSYPPGCSGPPDDDSPCEVCGLHPDNCMCPECPECGEIGNSECYMDETTGYIGCGLIRTPEQIRSLAVQEAAWAAACVDYEPPYCEECYGTGYTREDDGSFLPCEMCNGEGIKELQEEKS